MKHPSYDDMPIILQNYLKNYLIITKNRSKNTVNEYYYDLRDIFQFIKRDKYNLKIDNYKEIDISDLDLNFFKSVELSDIYNYLYDSTLYEMLLHRGLEYDENLQLKSSSMKLQLK